MNAPPFSKERRVWFYALNVLIAGVIFAIDAYLPLGINFSIPYFIWIGLSFSADWVDFPLIVAGASSFLLVLGAWLSPIGQTPIRVVLINRTTTFIVLWISGLFVWRAKKIAAGLREQARLLDLSSNAIIVRDERGNIVYWNKGAEQLYGWSPEEVQGNATHTLLQTLFPKPLPEIERELELSGHWTGELRHRQKNGNSVIVDSRWVLDREAPIGRSVMEVNTDITRRRQAELEQATLNLELARSNEALAQFSNVASHDLKEPLRTIVSFLSLLKQKFHGKVDEQADEYIRLVMDASQRMRNLIDDLLIYATVEAQPKEFEEVESDSVLKEVSMNLKASIEESGAEITFSPLPTVRADRSEVIQLFQNLISNAIKYRKAEVKPSIHIQVEQKSNDWVFSVRDNGIGFPDESRDRIFEPFRRLHGREVPGTGIGLSTCKKIVQRHGGKIWAESVPALGSTFYFTLPVTGPVESRLMGDSRVLVVDDTPEIQVLTSQLLRENGVTGDIAPTSADEPGAKHSRAV